MSVDPAQIATSQRHAMSIEEIKNLYGHLAAIVDAIAELCRDEGAARLGRGDIGCDRNHFAHGLAQEKMIVRHFVDASQPRDELEEPPDFAFVCAKRSRDVARPRRTKARVPTK